MRPLRIKASGSPITAANYQGLQEMNDAEIKLLPKKVIIEDKFDEFEPMD